MFVESSHDEQIIERVAALDIGKTEIVCCIRLPAADGGGRVQEVSTHSTMVTSWPGRSATNWTCPETRRAADRFPFARCNAETADEAALSEPRHSFVSVLSDAGVPLEE